MRQLANIIAIMFLCISVNAQNIIDSQFEYLVKNENASNVNVSGKVLQMMNGIDINEEYDKEKASEADNKTREFICSVSSFQMVECNELPTALAHYHKGIKIIDEEYDELLSVEDEEGHFRLYVDETDGVVSEVVGIGNYEDGIMIFSFEGEMEMDQVGEAIGNVHKNKFSKLNVKPVNPDDVVIFPNPVVANYDLSIRIPEEMKGAVAQLYYAEDKQFAGALVPTKHFKTYNIEESTQALNIQGIEAGTYVMKVIKGGVRVCKKLQVTN